MRFANLIAAALLALGPSPSSAQRTGIVAGDAGAAGPGTALTAGTAQLVATVEAIDTATRTITLLGSKGVQTLGVSNEVRNLPQVKVGDRVAVVYAQALARQLTRGGPGVRDHAETRAAAGARPPGAIGREMAVIGDVVAVNYVRQTVTLRDPARIVTLVVPDAAQLRAVTTGDQVYAIYTEALAVALKAAPRGSGVE